MLNEFNNPKLEILRIIFWILIVIICGFLAYKSFVHESKEFEEEYKNPKEPYIQEYDASLIK